ncbi:MAG: RNA methyltransferase [Eubacteriales bacterium]|nr:RNA methyltransferase [Eubacteriales bacterium]
MRSMINESTNQVNQNGADSSSSGRRRETAWEKWNRLCAGGCFCAVIPQELMWRICDTQTPQGILCVARQPHYELEEILEGTVVQTSGVLSPEIAAQTSGMPSPGIAVQISGLGGSDRAGRFAPPPLLLLLEDIQDPGNLGTMIRTAEAAGVTGIVMSRGTVDVFNPKTVRATMSALFRMPFFCAEDFVGTLGRIREKGIAIYAAHLEGARSYESCSYIEGTALLIGNEGNGLSDEAASAADYRIILPMRGRIESLNAAVAASVLLYEADRQRRMTE